MDNDVVEKIKEYCINGNMQKDTLKVITTEEGYVASDGFTSIMFDKNGNPSSLPMHRLYGDGGAKIAGLGYGLYTTLILIILSVAILYALIK